MVVAQTRCGSQGPGKWGILEMFSRWNQKGSMSLRGRWGGIKNYEWKPGLGNRMNSDVIYLDRQRESDGAKVGAGRKKC